MNKEQKYWYCPLNGKARLHFLWVLYYVGWIRELWESKQVLYAMCKEILQTLPWTDFFGVLGFCTTLRDILSLLSWTVKQSRNTLGILDRKKIDGWIFQNPHQQHTNPRRSACQKNDPNFIAAFILKFEENRQGVFRLNWQSVGIARIASLCFILFIRF